MEHDWQVTAAACSRRSCEDCEMEGQLPRLHNTPGGLADFAVLATGWSIPSCPINRFGNQNPPRGYHACSHEVQPVGAIQEGQRFLSISYL